MAKLTPLLSDNNLTKFFASWRPLFDFLQDKGGGKINFGIWNLRIRLDWIGLEIYCNILNIRLNILD